MKKLLTALALILAVVGSGYSMGKKPQKIKEPKPIYANNIISKVVNLDGYKGSKWGMSLNEAEHALKIATKTVSEYNKFTEYYDVPDYCFRDIFYYIFSVPVDPEFKKYANDEQKEAYSPEPGIIPKVFNAKQYADVDSLILYKGKLFAYSFSIKDNTTAIVNELKNKYGEGKYSRIDIYYQGSLREHYFGEVLEWNCGKTNIYIISRSIIVPTVFYVDSAAVQEIKLIGINRSNAHMKENSNKTTDILNKLE